MEKQAFGLLLKALPRLFRAAAPAVEHAVAPAAAKAVATGATEAAGAAAPGVLSKAMHYMNLGPGNIMRFAGNKMGGRFGGQLAHAGNWMASPIKGMPFGMSPQGMGMAYGMAGIPAAMLGYHLPGSDFMLDAAAPVWAAASAGASGIGNAVKGMRMQSPGNQQAFAQDMRSGAENMGYGLMDAAMQDPSLMNPGRMQEALGPEFMQQKAPDSTWEKVKQFFGRSDNDFVTGRALDAASGQIKQAGFGRNLLHTAMLGSVAAPAIMSFFGKPYDEQAASNAGATEAARQFSSAADNMNPFVRFMAQHIDPSLAVAGADKAHPGFAKGYSDHVMQTTGQPFSYGPLGSLYASWNGQNTLSNPSSTKYYINSSLGQPAYLS